jgi:hypothetical protein
MPREKDPGVDIEEQKSRLRVEEVDAVAKECDACAKERKESGDPTAYCAEHLRKIYGV